MMEFFGCQSINFVKPIRILQSIMWKKIFVIPLKESIQNLRDSLQYNLRLKRKIAKLIWDCLKKTKEFT